MKKKFKAIVGAVLASALCGIFAAGCGSTVVPPPPTGDDKEPPAFGKENVKILAIGNSFSDNAMKYLYPILTAFGAQNIVLGNLYIGGCTLKTHAGNATQNTSAYDYRKNTSGTFVTTSGTKMRDAIKDEEWQIITMQQASGVSGMLATYNEDIDILTAYVNANKTGDPRLGWHMTWAYQQNSTHGEFINYGNNQQTMYEKIVSCVNAKIDTNSEFDFVIPAGTAIQNARTSYIGDNLTIDGYHLNSLGEYIIGVTWVMKITGWPIEDLDENKVNPEFRGDIELIKESASNAIKKPYEITLSKFSEKPALPPIDMSKYELLDFDIVTCGHYNSASDDNGIITTMKNFACSGKRFTKEDIPVGSIIELKSGYSYRPDAWNTQTGASTAARPGNVTAERVVVDEAWWNGYVYRAFNLSKTGVKDTTGMEAEFKEAFKIYVPKK